MTAEPLYLVDSSVWILAYRRTPSDAVIRRLTDLLEKDAVASCGPIELEVIGGAASESEFSSLVENLRGVHHLAIQPSDWHDAARIAFDLRRVGITVPAIDALIAAVALRANAVLLHADRHFDQIAQHVPLRVESLVDLLAP